MHFYQSIDREEANERTKKVIKQYENKASQFCDWLEENFIEGLTFFDFPKEHWTKIRTNNAVERLNQEQKEECEQLGFFQV